MAKTRTVYRCDACGADAPRWAGRCPACSEWNSLTATAVGTPAGSEGLPAAQPMLDIDPAPAAMLPTGLPELDRVLGGGLVPGSVTLLGGEPGIGKSTLLMQALASLAASGRRCLLASGEESAHQVRLRAERVGAVVPDLWMLPDASLPATLAAVERTDPDVLVVDSIQTALDPDIGSAPGTVVQVQACTQRLVQEAKQRGLAVLLAGHVTKEGTLAGPRVLEHVVDTVLSFEGDRHHALRLLRAVKHRFGATGELGLFEMVDAGLVGVSDPSGVLLSDRREGVGGSVVMPAVDGQRPLLVELQALICRSTLAQPRRSGVGLDANRLGMLLAVLERRAQVPFSKLDVFASAVGGVRLVEPAADLAIAIALVSSLTSAPVAGDVVVCGEVGLAGEVRQVARTPQRLAEAARHGFRKAVVAASTPSVSTPLELIPVATVKDAIAALGCGPAPPSGRQMRVAPAVQAFERRER